MQLIPPFLLLAQIFQKMACNAVCSLEEYVSSSMTCVSITNTVHQLDKKKHRKQ
jgi:hypothetical protein